MVIKVEIPTHFIAYNNKGYYLINDGDVSYLGVGVEEFFAAFDAAAVLVESGDAAEHGFGVARDGEVTDGGDAIDAGLARWDQVTF